MKKSKGTKAALFPTPVFVVGTYGDNELPTAMPAAWGGICCSVPPCVAVSFHKNTYSYQNILKRRAFTVNIPSDQFIKEIDFFNYVSGRNVDKFGAMGLTSVQSDLVDAPYIKEFPFILECELLNSIDIGFHTQFIGRIRDIKAEETIFSEDGQIDIQKIKPLLFDMDTRRFLGIGPTLGQSQSLGLEV
jgi:flavin reductase (DIM6/NTAB) family NADH-FMN oxidoreductase RutF